MQHQEHIVLLTKKLSGEITAQELARLEEWLAASAEHQRIAASYQHVWDEVDNIEPSTDEIEPNLDDAFAKVMLRIREEKQKKPVFLGVLVHNLTRIAAALAFITVAVWGYYFISKSEEPIVVVANNHQEIQLPDGSKVWLRKGSSLSYPREFGSDLRCVELKGEGYFEVVHNPEIHFCVLTSGKEKVEVLGTSFNVKEMPSGTSVLVKTGKVRFDIGNVENGAIVTAGKIAVYERNTNKITLKEVNSFNELAWKAGHLEFINVPVRQVIADYESYFNIDIEVENQKLLDCTYTSTKVSNDVNTALNALKESLNIEFSFLSSNKVLFTGGTCL
jgi:transmembrane sensor